MSQKQYSLMKGVAEVFGNNKKRLFEILKRFDEKKRLDFWGTALFARCKRHLTIRSNLFEEVSIALRKKMFNEIDIKWMGDLSFTVDVVLNEDLKSGLDFFKKLANKCGGTIHFAVLDF